MKQANELGRDIYDNCLQNFDRNLGNSFCVHKKDYKYNM